MTTLRSQRGRAASLFTDPATVHPEMANGLLPTAIVPSVRPSALDAWEIGRQFRAILSSGVPLRPAGLARRDPSRLGRGRYIPTTRIRLFDTEFYLSDYFQTPQLRFFIAYVVQPGPGGTVEAVYPRIIYKDGSLIWRTASHMVSSDDDFWIGKGDIRSEIIGDEEHYESVESTTDLPFEMQTALEFAARRTIKIRNEKRALDLVLRNAPASRVRAYRDFTDPREEAAAYPRNLIHGNRPVARFSTRKGRKDPASLRFVKGYEPDFVHGIVEKAESTSVLYGGRLERFRILSANRRIQYLFFSGPLQVWIIPPQATTTVLSSFGVRTVDVVVDDDLCCPGYEYHFLDDTVEPPEFYSQIPEGYAGDYGPYDPSRADASPWLDRMPVIREFRRKVLGPRRRSERRAGKKTRPTRGC